MSHISKPIDWKVFSIPPIQPVQYYSVLKKKREFSQLIKQYDAQVFKQGYIHYCGIVPKNLSSSFNNRCELFIVFFDETPNTSFIGFRVKVSKETFIHESNSLLLFLKKSKKAVFYLMNNNCIHVQCGTNAWELFYLLYDDYLRRYVLTIIGTQFFYRFVYSCCIQREIQLLEMLYKGSKVIRVSTKSIYYKIHRKRKISVTDLIHMTLNMPKSKRYIVSCFSPKESILYSDLKDGNFYTAVGSKINVSKLMLKKFKKQNVLVEDTTEKNPVIFEENVPASSDYVLYPHSKSLTLPFKCKAYKSENHIQKLSFNNTTLKRKFDEIELHPSTSKCFKTSESCFVGNQWKQYQNLKPYSVKCYSGIPFINPLVPALLKNESSSHFNSNSYFLKTHSNAFTLSLMPSDEKKLNDISTVQETHELIDHLKSHRSCSTHMKKDSNYKISEAIDGNAIPHESKHSFDILPDCVMPQVFLPNQPNFHGGSNIKKDSDIKATTSLSLPRATECINQDCFSSLCLEDVSFTTAAGKTINISDTAMLKAHQLIENDFSDESKELPKTYNIGKNKICSKTPNFKIIYPDLKRKTATEDISLPKSAENKLSCDIISIKNNEIMPKKLATAVSNNTDESFRLGSLDAVEDVGFSTAAGKTINVSSTAMEAAQKLIQDVFDEEKKLQELCSGSRHLHTETHKIHRNISAFKDISCPSKAVDIDMDKTLVDKFFEDTLFDEKELELTDDCNKNDNSDSVLKSKSDKHLLTHKPRKSLGGRRSMKYCSDKL